MSEKPAWVVWLSKLYAPGNSWGFAAPWVTGALALAATWWAIERNSDKSWWPDHQLVTLEAVAVLLVVNGVLGNWLHYTRLKREYERARSVDEV